jgi:hypothetical protein
VRRSGIFDDIEGWLDARKAEVEPIARDVLSRLDRSPIAKTVGGNIALRAGNVAGVGRGAWHTVEGTARGAYFVSRLLDPYDLEAKNVALNRALNAGKDAFDYAKSGFGIARRLISTCRAYPAVILRKNFAVCSPPLK